MKIQICFQDKQINGEVDTLLRKLEEFEELLALSQSDGNVCLFKHVPGLQNKFAEMQNVFDEIDRYGINLSIKMSHEIFPKNLRQIFLHLDWNLWWLASKTTWTKSSFS